MNYKKILPCLLQLLFLIILSSCDGQSKKTSVERSKDDSNLPTKEENKTDARSRSPLQKMNSGKGSLSFKLDGILYQTDPGHTKCWSTDNIHLAMLMAKGEGLSVSWQMSYTEVETSYRLDKDRKGTVNFTIGEKTYWTKSVLGDDYLDIKITRVKDKYSLKLLSGTFEGILEDKDGNKVNITEGRFETEDIGGM